MNCLSWIKRSLWNTSNTMRRTSPIRKARLSQWGGRLEDRVTPTGSPTIDWARQFGSFLPTYDEFRSVDSDGNIYIAGLVAGSLPTQIEIGGNDAFVAKYDSTGTLEWTRQFGSPSQDFARGIAVDSTGVYVVGETFGALPGQVSEGATDAFVLKFDADGQLDWTRQFGSSANDSATGICIGPTGVYLTGSTDGALLGQVMAGGSDAFVARFDGDGNQMGSRQFGSSSNDHGISISADGSSVYLLGMAFGLLPGESTHFGTTFITQCDATGSLDVNWTRSFGFGAVSPGAGAYGGNPGGIALDATGIYVAGGTGTFHPGQGPIGDAYLRKYDVSGNLLWHQLLSSPDNDAATSVSADATGIYVAGATWGALPAQSSYGGADAFLAKYDSNGNLDWLRQFGANHEDRAFGVAADDGSISVTGTTDVSTFGTEQIDGFLYQFDSIGAEVWSRQLGSFTTGFTDGKATTADPFGNVYVIGHVTGIIAGQTPIDGSDCFVTKYDPAGVQIWTRQFGTNNSDPVFTGVADGSGIYIGGMTLGTWPDETSSGDFDAYIAKLDPDGELLWARQFGSADRDCVNSISISSSGIYIAGQTYGTLPGQTSAGGADLFVGKIDANGNEIWMRQFGSSEFDSDSLVSVDSSNVYVGGLVDAALPGQTSIGSTDAFVSRYSDTGVLLWTSQFGTLGIEYTSGMMAESGNVYIVGATTGEFPGQSFAGGTYDGFVARFDSSGNQSWVRQIGTTDYDDIYDVYADATGAFVAGNTEGTLAGQSSSGSGDLFLVRIDADGTPSSTFQFGSSGYDYTTGLTVSASAFYVAGYTDGALPGQTVVSSSDAFLIRLAPADPAPIADLNGPTTGFDGQVLTFTLTANDTPADMAAGFTFEIDWDGNGSADGSVSGPSGTTVDRAFAAGTYGVRVRAMDVNGTFGEWSNSWTVAIETVTAENLQEQLPPSGGEVNIEADTQQEVAQLVSAVNTLTPPSQPVEVIVDLGGNDFTGITASPPPNVTLTFVNGTFNGASPALIVASGEVIILNSTFTNATDAPTILVTGGHLTLRGCFIDESTGYDQTAIVVTGGMVDLGTAAEPGNNSLNVNGAGSFVHNTTSTPVSAVGVVFTDNGLTSSPSVIQGLVWVDFNNDGLVDFNERVIEGAVITLTGTNDLGEPVLEIVLTDGDGIYTFGNLRPSNAAGYTITESQPGGYLDGRDTLGTIDNVTVGNVVVNDAFSSILLGGSGTVAENYNFGERPATTGGVSSGQAAGIGFWQNKHGQNLIKALNGGANATQLGHWLAATFPNMYAALHGLTNAQVAAHYKVLFSQNGQSSPGGPPKMDAQVMATALAVYMTNQSLAGATATAYGFQVTQYGVGARAFNVGNKGAAFGVANNSDLSVMDLLLAVNARSHNGLLDDQNGDGVISASEESLRSMANDVFSGINEAGNM
jgi:hypothetical protein